MKGSFIEGLSPKSPLTSSSLADVLGIGEGFSSDSVFAGSDASSSSSYFGSVVSVSGFSVGYSSSVSSAGSYLCMCFDF
jgi:hypothetical protein